VVEHNIADFHAQPLRGGANTAFLTPTGSVRVDGNQ